MLNRLMSGRRGRAMARAALAAMMIGGGAALVASPPALAAEAQTQTQTPAEALATRAEALRLFGPGSKAPMAQFSADEQAATAGFYGTVEAADREMFTRYLSGVRQYVLVKDDRGITGWWNPYAAIWVIGDWQRASDGTWQLKKLAPLTPEDIAAPDQTEELDLAPAWARVGTDPIGALVAQDKSAVKTFEAAAVDNRVAPLLADDERIIAARTLILMREAAFSNQVGHVRNLPGYGNVWIDLAQAITQQSDKSVPAEISRSLMPVAALRMSNGVEVLMASPFAPATAIIVSYAAPATPNGEAIAIAVHRIAFFKGGIS